MIDENGLPISDKVTDFFGLDRVEKTVYIQVNCEDQDKATKVLSGNEISNRVFDTAGEAHCQTLAEAELRGIAESIGLDEEKRELMCRLYRDQVGRGLLENIDSFVADGVVAGIASDIYYTDIVERVDEEIAIKLSTELKEELKEAVG